jgi:hypothetical protein
MTHRPFARSVLITSLVALLSVPPAWAGINPQPFRTGLFGVTAGQTVRVSVLNAGDDELANPCFQMGGLVVTMTGAAGRVLFQSKHTALLPGTGAFADFTPDDDAGQTRAPGAVARVRRIQMGAEVAIDLLPISGAARCANDAVAKRQARRLLRQVHLTLEVFETATGRTGFTLPFSAVMFNPQPEPPEPAAIP